MTFYADMAQTASDLLAEFGIPVTVRRETGGTIDPVTGETTPPTVTTYAPYGILKPYPENLIDGTRITSEDRLLIMEAGVVEPETSDTLTIAGANWPIMEITTSNPAGTPLVYFVRVRR